MTLRANVFRVFSTVFTSNTLRNTRRRIARIRRAGADGIVHYFHQTDDPYSHLAAQTLSPLTERYRIRLEPHIVPPPDDAAAPERVRLKSYALRDAACVARRYGLAYPNSASELNSETTAAANAQLAKAIADGGFAESAPSISVALWQGAASNAPALGEDATARMMAEGDALRRSLGHYLSGMFYFDGEWYWGVDRLHHLETRLRHEKLVRVPALPRIAPYQEMALDGAPATGAKPTIEFWFSFRSPYSYIAAPRLHKLAAHYGAEVRWRFILPMIMRGLPVPPAKTRYIMLDVKREAELLRIPYGTMVDPRGEGIHRALAVLHHAIQMGKGAAYAESGLAAAFTDGIDMATDKGLMWTAKRAGLSEADVEAALADESWRPVAEENRKALFDAGLWGAPTYRVNGGPAYWGQDRLWLLEEDLKAVIARAH